MDLIDALVIGAGQAGLAVSRGLTDASVDHVVLERGRLAERWRSERWDSLRLLTPNWATRLPGWHYTGPEPDGFMTAGELVDYFESYARSFGPPIRAGQTVRSVEPLANGFAVSTDDATPHAGNVVIATGWSAEPRVPAAAEDLDRRLLQLTPSSYRNPRQLPDGGVLIVGASASGVQLADELVRADREVVLAVGGHVQMARRYRGVDIWTWLDRIGMFATTIDEVGDRREAQRQGSAQLIGRDDGRDVDLPALQRIGVRLAGRLLSVDGSTARFADDLGTTTAVAHDRLQTLLSRIDAFIDGHGLAADVLPATPAPSVTLGPSMDRLDLRGRGIPTVIWATGHTRSYPWLRVPVLDTDGEIAQRRGLTQHPGLYVVGQRFQHRRDSNFIDGVRHDAGFIVRHIAARRGHHAAA